MKIALNLAGYAVVVIIVALVWLHSYNKGYEDAADFWSTYKREARVYRELYLRAEEDAKVMNCIPLDNNYFMCEKKAHAQR